MTERTPAGGDRSEITYFDRDGNITTTPDDAVEVEIREYAGDILIARTYMDRTAVTPTWTPPGDVLAEPDVSDQAKNTWSVYSHDDGIFRLANTVDSLLSAMDMGAAAPQEQRAFLLNLMSLPSWAAAPLELRQDAAHWLTQH